MSDEVRYTMLMDADAVRNMERLREIARNGPFDERRSAIFKLADAIAAELEAPAADVPVVAYGYENTRPTERAPLMMVRLSNAGDQYPELATKLVRQRDHIATVAALQARIASLEDDLAHAHHAADLNSRDAMARINALEARQV